MSLWLRPTGPGARNSLRPRGLALRNPPPVQELPDTEPRFRRSATTMERAATMVASAIAGPSMTVNLETLLDANRGSVADAKTPQSIRVKPVGGQLRFGLAVAIYVLLAERLLLLGAAFLALALLGYDLVLHFTR